MKKFSLYLLFVVISIAAFSCKSEKEETGKLKVATTTTMITDLIRNIAKDSVELEGLMGSGVDPHLYKASEGDVNKLGNADLIFYNGLHLEGKLVEVFEKMEDYGIHTVALSDALDPSTFIGSEAFQGNYDPHIWFDIDNWIAIGEYAMETLAEADPKHAGYYTQNWSVYREQLIELKSQLKQKIDELEPSQRILVTAHDAFNYFGKAFGFEVVGLQGLSTATEAGVKDVQNLSNFIIEKKVKAIFVESSVPKRTIEALQAAVKAKGNEVEIGGTLYSDALGDAGTKEGEYIGMFLHNVNTMVDALK